MYRHAIGAGLLAVAGLLAACGSHQAPPPAAQRSLNLYNWSNYIDPTVLADFERQTGIHIRLATYPNQESMQAVLLTGQSQYDVVVVSSDVLEYLSGAHAFRELDRAQLPDWGNLDAAMLERLTAQDPGHRYGVPYLWGTTGLSLNITRIAQVAPRMPVDSWTLLFDPANAAQVARCGIFVNDEPNEVTDSALLFLGKEANSAAPADLDQAGELLMRIRRHVGKIEGEGQINDLASGEMCAEITSTSVMVQAKRRARETGGTAELRYVIPREGAIMFIDTLAIPVDAPHPAEAHAFINFLLRGDVAARNANLTGGASPNRAAFTAIEPWIRDDPAIYPPPEVQRKLQLMRARSPESSRIVTRNWTRFKTGR